MKKALSIVLVLVLVMGLAACGVSGDIESAGSASSSSQAESSESSVPPSTETSEVIEEPVESAADDVLLDLEGNELVLPASMDKIICLSPAVTQVLIDLGVEEQLIAVDPYSLPLVQNQEMQTFEIMNPDAELLASMEADIVFATGMSKKDGDDPLALLKDLGIVVVYVPVSDTIEEIKETLLFLGQVVGAPEKSEALVATMETQLEDFKTRAANVTEKKTVYFEISPAPNMYSFGSGVYLNEMLELIGAENIFQDEERWIAVAPEAVVEANPDVIITNVDYQEDPVGEMKSRVGFDAITAVQNDAVYVVSNQTSSYSNHYIIKGLEQIAAAIYPQEFGADA